MMKLNEELRSALAKATSPLLMEDEATKTVYVVVEESLHREAMRALARERDDLASIARGLAQMEAGLGRPLAVVDADIRRELGFSPRP